MTPKLFISILTAIVLCLSIFACTSKNTSESGTQKIAPYKFPEVPSFITDPTAQASYAATHFWDNYNFNDTLYISIIDDKQALFSNYITALSYSEKKTIDNSIKETLKKAETEETGTMYAAFLKTFKHYLHDPNSPLRNEDMYITVLEYAIASEKTELATRERSKFELEMAMKNRVGDKATDLVYTLSSGKTGSLYSIRSPYTIILFYNPDCHSCAEIIGGLKASPIITNRVKNKQIAILSFYPDEDLEIWKKHLQDIPAEWVNGYDKDRKTENEQLYDLKAIPTLYLLDADKRVLLKDVPAPVLEEYLMIHL